MTTEERLNEIVEQQKGDAIIPFLQGLTQEERTSLIPCLNKLERYYKKLIQLEQNRYGTRATGKQHHILSLAALVIYPLKEFRKYESGINIELVNELSTWHIPSWLDNFFREGEGKEFGGFYHMNYEVLMDWLERGILTVAPTPQTIAGYLVYHIGDIGLLKKRAITLKEHIWYLFEYDCGQNWADSRSGESPYYAYKYFIEQGLLDRKRVLKESLLAVNRNMNKNLCGWFAGMFEALEPSVEEQLQLQPELLAVLSCPYSRPVNTVLKRLKALCSHPLFQTEEFLSQTSILFASDVKAVHLNTLAVLGKLAKDRETYRDAVCCAAAQGLVSREEVVQSKIIQLFQTYGNRESATLQEALSTYAPVLLATTRQKLGLCPDNAASPAPNESIPSLISEENRLPEVSSTEELLFLASQVLEGHEAYHFEQFIGALIQWDGELAPRHLSQWTPVLQRAYNLILSFGNAHTGMLDIMMATFFVDYARLLIRRFPEEGKELQALHDKMVKKDNTKQGQWRFCNLQAHTVRDREEKRVEHSVHRHLLCHALDILQSTAPRLPLLSTPTHAPLFVAPETLVQRLKQYQQTGIEPDDLDMQIALSRTALDEAQRLLPIVACELEGEYRALLLFLFGEKEAAPQAPFAHPSWWMTAGLIKSSEAVYPAFKDFVYNDCPREFLTGNFAWKTIQEHHTYTAYNQKEITWTSCDLKMDIPASPNVRKVNRGMCTQKIEYIPSAPQPLLVEMYPSMQYFDSALNNDLCRLLWLVPNTPEPLLAWCIRQAIYNPQLNEVNENTLTRITLETFNQLPHTWHETSYLLEAICMLVANKTNRAYAAEIWMDRVSKSRIDSSHIGKVLGVLQRGGWGPLKRLTDLIQQQMTGISPLHNRELEKLLTALIAELPETPVKDLKKLLEIYAELLATNHSRTEDERLLRLMACWQERANLKKTVSRIFRQ